MGPAKRRQPDRRSSHPDRSQPPHTPAPPIYVFSRAAIRSLDEAATRDYALPSILLMEHASLALVRHVSEMLDSPAAAVLICCGKGNNAGDGLALARHLHLAGHSIRLALAAAPEEYTGDAGVNLAMAQRLGIDLRPVPPTGALLDDPRPALVVDALLGTGISGRPRGVIAAMIQGVNDLHQRGTPVLAVDIPSGLDADSGAPAGGGDWSDVVAADRTVTFVGLKSGFLALGAQQVLGDLFVEGIGTPVELSERLGQRLQETGHADDDDARLIPRAPSRVGRGDAGRGQGGQGEKGGRGRPGARPGGQRGGPRGR